MLSTSKSIVTPLLDENGKKQYQRIIGCLLYLMHCTRPDLAYAVIKLSQFASAPQNHHWEDIKRILRYLRGTTNARLILGKRNTNADDADLVGFFDAAHGDTIDRRSTGGYIFLYHGSPISWTSKVQRTIALSTVEAEYMSGTEACKELIWIRQILLGFGVLAIDAPATILKGDNTGAIALSKNPEFHQKTKHIQLRERFISFLVDKNIVKVVYVPTEDMLADGLTKPLTKERHYRHLEKLGLDLQLTYNCGKCRLDFMSKADLDEHVASQKHGDLFTINGRKRKYGAISQ